MTSEFYLSKPPSILDKVTTLPVFPCLEYTYLYSYNLPSIWANRRNNDVEKYSVLMCCNFVFILLLSLQCLLPKSCLCCGLTECRLSSFSRNNTFFNFIAAKGIFFSSSTCNSLNPHCTLSSGVYTCTFPFMLHINLNVLSTDLLKVTLVFLTEFENWAPQGTRTLKRRI